MSVILSRPSRRSLLRGSIAGAAGPLWPVLQCPIAACSAVHVTGGTCVAGTGEASVGAWFAWPAC